MYIKSELKDKLLNQSIVGIYIGIDKDITLGLNNLFNIEIVNTYIFNDRLENLIGKSIIEIEEKENTYIKLILNNNNYIEIDMSDTGFNGPEAVLIRNNNEHYLYVVRDFNDIVEFD
ncbi:MAG: hypothetical protein ACI4N3_01580 [Alphaproteobacteria bacterium]